MIEMILKGDTVKVLKVDYYNETFGEIKNGNKYIVRDTIDNDIFIINPVSTCWNYLREGQYTLYKRPFKNHIKSLLYYVK